MQIARNGTRAKPVTDDEEVSLVEGPQHSDHFLAPAIDTHFEKFSENVFDAANAAAEIEDSEVNHYQN